MLKTCIMNKIISLFIFSILLFSCSETKKENVVNQSEIENTENSLCIKESLIQFNRFTEKPFVEILNAEGLFIKKDITIGISDGISVDVLEGVEEDDKIKVFDAKH